MAYEYKCLISADPCQTVPEGESDHSLFQQAFCASKTRLPIFLLFSRQSLLFCFCCLLKSRELEVIFSIAIYHFVYKREGRSLRCCTNSLWVNYAIVIQVTKSWAYPLNKQFHALSSALYQKFGTFKVLLSFCFFNEIWLIAVIHSHLCCVIYIYPSECVLTIDWSR